MKELKLLFIVADRAKIDKIAKTAALNGAEFAHIFYGRGTAKNEVLNLLGLGETEKGVIVAAAAADATESVFRDLCNLYGFDKAGGGIAFTVPMRSVGGPATLKILRGGKE